MHKFEVVTGYTDIILPKRGTAGSAGYDFHMPEDLTLMPGEEYKVKTGVKCQIEDGWFLAIFPRSSLGFKYKMRLANTVGVIDSDYYNNESNEGHIMIKICNEGSNMIKLNKGDAFAQGIFIPYGVTADDDVKEKRTGGIGSTGR